MFEGKLSKKRGFSQKMLTSAKFSTFLNFFFRKFLKGNIFIPNFSSVALFVQKLFRWDNFTPTQLFNVHKNTQLGKG